AAGGSGACAVGAQIAIDLVNERGGVAGKYKVVPVNADCQSKVDVAINEVERLIDQEKVEIVNGVYASAQAVPLAAKVDAQKKILWITTCFAARFTPTNMARHLRHLSPTTPKRGSAPIRKTSKWRSFTKMALTAVGVAEATERFGKQRGLQLILREGYSATAPD